MSFAIRMMDTEMEAELIFSRSVDLYRRQPRLAADRALRYRIEAAGMKGMTSQQTPDSQVGALDDAISVNRQAGILRTTRVKSARRA
jgi:hypothetical protein